MSRCGYFNALRRVFSTSTPTLSPSSVQSFSRRTCPLYPRHFGTAAEALSPPMNTMTENFYAIPKLSPIKIFHQYVEHPQPNVLIVDVRKEKELLHGMVPKAVSCPLPNIREYFSSHSIPSNVEVILYCTTGRRSLLAAQQLQSMGYHNVKSMEGGMAAWKNAELGNYPISMPSFLVKALQKRHVLPENLTNCPHSNSGFGKFL